MTRPMSRFGTLTAVLLLCLALALSACGRRGDLRPPEGEEGAYTGLGTYPAPESVVPQGGGSGAAEDETGEEGAETP